MQQIHHVEMADVLLNRPVKRNRFGDITAARYSAERIERIVFRERIAVLRQRIRCLGIRKSTNREIVLNLIADTLFDQRDRFLKRMQVRDVDIMHDGVADCDIFDRFHRSNCWVLKISTQAKWNDYQRLTT